MKKTLQKFLLVLICFTLLTNSSFSQSNQYLHFDKVDDFVKLPQASSLIANKTAISMTGWFYNDMLEYGQGMLSFRGPIQGFYLIQLNNGQIECRFINSSNITAEVLAPVNTTIPQTWQHFAWVYDGSAVYLYVDGNLAGTTSASGTITDGAIDFTIGKSVWSTLNFVYGGRIDEVSVWTKALSQTEIQDIMTNELTGNESELQLYYKFDQGTPAGNNTSITHLISETGGGAYDAELMNFALTGETSNFNGTLNLGFQSINFDPVPNKLTTDPDFDIVATATSGLPVSFEIVSGPATINGSTISLSGDSGLVEVKAMQAGDTAYNPALDVFNSFIVLDPAENVPNIDVRSPLAGDVYVPVLTPIRLAAIAYIDYPELFSINELAFYVDGQTFIATDHENGHYTAWWQPSDYGNFTITVVAKNNYFANSSYDVNINITQNADNKNVEVCDSLWLTTSIPTQSITANLPSYLGAFSNITANLSVKCPEGGCGEWDRVATIEAKDHDGRWIEIIRYITPYGVPCDHSVDLTDYRSILQGKIDFRLSCGTFDNGYLYELSLDYTSGTPDHLYSAIDVIWNETYPFGDYANLQPVETVSYDFSENVIAAKLKIMNTGHSWGDLNTGNAAEFFEANHKIVVNSDEFNQHLWVECGTNPDGCQPQNGTWSFDRAGWCPGSISYVYEYDLANYITMSGVNFDYVFQEDYIDLCHPNHPDCVTGVTCTDCSSNDNPHYIVAANLISFSDTVIQGTVSDINEYEILKIDIQTYPNPSNGEFVLSSNKPFQNTNVNVINNTGSIVHCFEWNSTIQSVNLRFLNKGVYILEFSVEEKTFSKRIVIL